MKKKFITSILALICAMVCVFPLMACGSNPKKMKGENVTEEQWKDAFKEDNFKNVKIQSTMTEEDEYEMENGTKEDAKVTMKSTVIIVDDMQYYKTEIIVEKGPQELKDYAKTMNFEKYSSLKDGKYTTYYKNKDGKWRQCPGDGGVADEVIASYVALKTMYDKYEYQDGWVKGYWLKEGSFGGQAVRSYKFKNGKLSVVCTYEDDEVTTFVYGGQKITLPTPEDSAYAGKWNTHQLILGDTTYKVNDKISEWGNQSLSADFVTVDVKNDGTSIFTNPNGSGSGIWMETYDGISFTSEDMGGSYELEFDGTYLKIEIDSSMTVVLVKA